MSNVNAKIIYLPGADTNITVTRRNRVHIRPVARRKPNMLQRLASWWDKETMNMMDSVYLGVIFVVFMAALFAAYAVGIQVLDWVFSLLN